MPSSGVSSAEDPGSAACHMTALRVSSNNVCSTRTGEVNPWYKAPGIYIATHSSLGYFQGDFFLFQSSFLRRAVRNGSHTESGL